jgi:hypothetical protein
MMVAVLVAPAAHGATMADVNDLLRKAGAVLRAADADRAGSLREAIDLCRRALETLEAVPDLSEEQRDKKSAEILSTVYWCRKMMPLDLHGNQKASAATQSASAPKPPQGGQAEEAAAPAPRAKVEEHDKAAFESTKSYARRNPQDLEGALIRYEGIAASYPKTKWGMKAADEATTLRGQIEKARDAVLATRKEQIARLEVDEALKAIEADIASPQMKSKRVQLEELAADIRALQKLKGKLIEALELSPVSLSEPLATYGIEKEGFLLGGNAEGVTVVLGAKTSPRTKWQWSAFGAKAMVRLASRYTRGAQADWVEMVAVGATITEDFMLAHELFGRLITLAPERATNLIGYFARATTGYRSSAQGHTQLALDEAKKLIRAKDYVEAFKLLGEIREELASNSAMVDKLKEVNDFRLETMLRYKLNGEGAPLNAFEKKCRAVFGGEVKLDEQTGKIEVLYDFSNARQLHDFQIGVYYGQWRNSGWTVSGGRVASLGKDLNLFWKFPITDVDVQAEVIYNTPDGRCELSVQNNANRLDVAIGGFADGLAGYVSQRTNRLYSYGYTREEVSPIIWRPGEAATLRITTSHYGPDYFNLYFNGDLVAYTYSWADAPRPGSVAFSFDGGTGSIDNILIRGTLDMKWFEENTRRIPNRR